MANFIHQGVAGDAKAYAAAAAQVLQQSLTVELDADAARTRREHPPVVIGFAALGEAQGKDTGKGFFSAIELNVVGIVAIVPGIGIEQRQSLAAQEIEQRRQIGITAQKARRIAGSLLFAAAGRLRLPPDGTGPSLACGRHRRLEYWRQALIICPPPPLCNRPAVRRLLAGEAFGVRAIVAAMAAA